MGMASTRILAPNRSVQTTMPMHAARRIDFLDAIPGLTTNSHQAAGRATARSNVAASVNNRGCSGNCREATSANSAAKVAVANNPNNTIGRDRDARKASTTQA